MARELIEADLDAEVEALISQKRRAGEPIIEASLVAQVLARHKLPSSVGGDVAGFLALCARETVGRIVRRVLGSEPDPPELTAEEYRELGECHHWHADALEKLARLRAAKGDDLCGACSHPWRLHAEIGDWCARCAAPCEFLPAARS